MITLSSYRLIALAALSWCAPFTWIISQGAELARPEWIWSSRDRSEPASLVLAKSFRIEGEAGQATLRAGADFCGLEVWLNGDRAGFLAPYADHCEVEVMRLLRKGENRVEVRAVGTDGPAAVVVQIDGTRENGERWSMRSGGDWEVRAAGDPGEGEWQPAVSFGPLASLGWRDGKALPSIGAFDEYNQWKEALGAAEAGSEAGFSKLPAGFEIELLRTAAEGEGSWVSMAVDPRGRLILAREDRGLLRVSLDREGGKVSEVESINDNLLECRGLLFAHGSLYANANNSKALYRLRDTNGDDRFDEVVPLTKTGGGVGHGRNDLALGPDGLIYAIHGDSVEVPGHSTTRTPPVAETFRNEGHLVRTDAEGTRWEVVASGLRNPFGIDFNPEGEAFTYDADNESDMGLPFYRPTRVNHLVSGVDYGWRQGGNSWPVYAPDSLPTTIDIGHGSPTAVKFGTHSNFPPGYREALFILDWAYGRIMVVRTIPRGASYACRVETFLRGRPLNVTDLDFGPDGALYFVTGGRRTRSGLYRIRFTGGEIAPEIPTAQEVARSEFSKRARAMRRELERWHEAGSDSTVIDPVWKQLGNSDPWIRQAARVALEHQPVSLWRHRALEEAPSESVPTLNALLALARVGRPEELSGVVAALARFEYSKLSRMERLTVLRAYDICLRRKVPLGDAARVRIFGQTDSSFPGDSLAENRELAKLLVTLESPSSVSKCLELLGRSGTQQEELFYLEVLSRAGGGTWTRPQRETFWRSLQRARAFDGDTSLAGFIGGIRKGALERLPDDDRAALAHLIDWKEPATIQPDPAAAGREIVKHWSEAELATALTARASGPPPDFDRGRKMYAVALCIHCHQIGASGLPVGPNLSAVSSRFGRRDLLESILEPSKVVAAPYRNHVIVKKGEARETVVGRVIQNDFRRSAVTLATNPFAPWQFTEVSKHEIASHEVSPISPMPSGLLDTLSLEEIRDLIAYLEAAGDPRHVLFRDRDPDQEPR